jgi:hypothetical protein
LSITVLSGSGTVVEQKYNSFAVSVMGGVLYYVYKDGSCYTAQYHVKSGGNDSNSGLTEAAAFATLKKAVDKAKEAGSRIKTITVYGMIIGADDAASGFYLKDVGNITIKGADTAAELRPEDARRAVYVGGQSNVYFSSIKITGGNGQTQGGGIYMDGPNTAVTLGPGAEVVGNRTLDYGEGGGVYIKGATLNIISGAISANRSYATDNIANGQKGTGGGIYMLGGNLNMTGGVIGGKTDSKSKNMVNWNNANDSSYEYYDGIKDGNRAANAGGVYISSASVSLESGALIQFNRQENMASANGGGGLFVQNADVTLNAGSKINYNYAAQDGGGVYVKVGTITIHKNCEISYNRARYGGGIYPHEGGRFILQEAAIENNHATESGGGVHTYGGALEMYKSIIAKNSAVLDGGGICVSSGRWYEIKISSDSKVFGNNGGTDANTSGKTGDAYYSKSLTEENTITNFERSGYE